MPPHDPAEGLEEKVVHILARGAVFVQVQVDVERRRRLGGCAASPASRISFGAHQRIPGVRPQASELLRKKACGMRPDFHWWESMPLNRRWRGSH